jgi:O-antigen ligase
MTLAALLYAAFSATSTLWSEHPQDFFFFALQWWVLATWLIGTCLIFLNTEVNIEKIILWLVVIGVLVVASTIIYFFLVVDSSLPMRNRLSGWNAFRNANEFGAFCGVIALLALIMALHSSSLLSATKFYSLTLFACAGLLVSLSRGAILSLLIISPFIIAIIRPPLKIWLPPVILCAASLLLALSLTDIFTFYMSGRAEGLGGRSTIWSEIIFRSKDNLLAGIGLTKDSTIFLANGEEFNHAHSAWLDTLYRTGLIGLLLLLIHLASVLRKFSSTKELLPLYAWLIYGCLCSFLDGRILFWEIGAKWFFYWIPAGLITAVVTNQMKTLTEKP